MAVAYSKMNKNEESLKVLNKCLKLNPDYTKAYAKRGDINKALGNHEEALRDYQKANELDPAAFQLQDKIRHAK